MSSTALRQVAIDVVFVFLRICSDLFGLVVLVCFLLPYQLVCFLKRTLLSCCSSSASPKPSKFRGALITGASVGLGAALAKEFAEPGVSLFITATTKGSLESTKKACLEKGADRVECFYVDVSDEAAMRRAVAEAEGIAPLDLIVCNAGISPKKDGVEESIRTWNVNLMGTLHTLIPALPGLKARGRGQVVLLGSMSSYALAASKLLTPYVASKHAVRVYAEGLRTFMAPHGVGVTLICPGFTSSRLLDEQLESGLRLPSLFITDIDYAAELMRRGIEENAPEIAWPLWLYLVTKVTGFTPVSLRQLMTPFLMFDPYVMLDSTLEDATQRKMRATLEKVE